MIVSGWEVNRGRSYELDKNEPGTATISLVDLTGELDPASFAYSFTPGTPGAIAIRNPVTSTDSPIFVGYISRYEYELYKTEDYAVGTLYLVDGLDRLARTEMHPGQGYTLEWGDFAADSGAQDGDLWFYADEQVEHRINQLLDQASWPASQREIFSGNVALQSTVYAYRTPCLSAIYDAADAEYPGVANFYIAKDGKATFHGRQARFRPNVAQYHITTWTAGDLDNAGTGPLIFDLKYDLDVERVINSAIATPKDIADADIAAQRVEDSDSISTYGSRSVSFDNLITERDYFGADTPEEATLKFADYYVANYAQPAVEIRSVTFQWLPPGHPDAASQWALLGGIDISDRITITTNRISGTYFVEGLHYTASPVADTHDAVMLEVDLSPEAYYLTNPFE